MTLAQSTGSIGNIAQLARDTLGRVFLTQLNFSEFSE